MDWWSHGGSTLMVRHKYGQCYRKANEDCWAVKADMWLFYCACIPITSHSKCRLSGLQLFLIPPSVVFYLACCCPSACFHVYACISVLVCCFLFALYVCLLIHMSCCLCPCLPDRRVLVCVVYVCVWSVQWKVPGLAGHHGHSVRCRVVVGTTSGHVLAQAQHPPTEGTSASGCIQRRLCATHTPARVSPPSGPATKQLLSGCDSQLWAAGPDKSVKMCCLHLYAQDQIWIFFFFF